MGRLGEQDRAELEAMRDNIVTRMNELQDQVDHGTLSDQKRYKKLEDEFGFDYLQTLSNINELLHNSNEHTHVTPKTLIASVLGLFLFSIAITTFFTLSPTGMATITVQETIQLQTSLSAGQSQLLELPPRTSILEVDMQPAVDLDIEHATQQIALYRNNTCIGCGVAIQQPYMIKNTGEQATTIQYIKVLRT